MTHDAAPVHGARARSLGSAKSGAADAWRMHVTSVALIPLSLAFVWIMLSLVGKDYAGVRAELAQPCQAIVLLLFVLAGVCAYEDRDAVDHRRLHSLAACQRMGRSSPIHCFA